MRTQQRGMTFIGLLFTLAVIGIIVFAALRLVPVYLEHMKIVTVMDGVSADLDGTNPSLTQVRQGLDSRLYIEGVKVVRTGDFKIEKADNGYRMTLAYEQTAPYIANISFLVNFSRSVEVRR